MKALKRIILVTATILCYQVVNGYDDYNDSKRPYEFGFSIDGQQHRHEKKDKNGIIMGEFGFITADDVYHVTVYATDENGRFKILSMKNIHLKATSAYSRQGHSLQLPPATPSSTLPKPTPVKPIAALAPNLEIQNPQHNLKPISIQPPANSCSHCSLPTTSTPAPRPALLPNSQTSISTNNNANPSVFSSSGVGDIINPQKANTFPQNPRQQNTFGVSSKSGTSSQSTTKEQTSGSPIIGQAPVSVGSPYNSSPYYPQQFSRGAQPANQGYINEQSYSTGPQKFPGQSGPSVPSSIIAPPIVLPRQNGINYQKQNAGPIQGIAGSEKYTPAYSQSSPQAPGTVQSFNIAPNLIPTQNVPGANKFPSLLPASKNQPELTSSQGLRTPKQFSEAQEKPTGFSQQNYPQNNVNGFGGSQGGQPASKKPVLVSAQMQIVDKNTDIHSNRPGEKSGLPEGLAENDIMHLLYTFNYTLGFQAHYEEGYTNGFKQGYYYVTGRNGVRTRIDYTADDTGFHPKISQDVLDLLSDDVPKPETEKDAKYGLRGYEFKWLYYPVEHKSR